MTPDAPLGTEYYDADTSFLLGHNAQCEGEHRLPVSESISLRPVEPRATATDPCIEAPFYLYSSL